MHILLIHQVFVRPEDPGGTRHYEIASRLVQDGHRVTVLASPFSYQNGVRLAPTGRLVLASGLEVIYCRVWGHVNRSFYWRTIGFLTFMISSFWTGLRLPNVDLVWGTSPPLPQAFAGWLVARCKRRPFAFEVRDLWPAFAVQMGVLKNPLLIAVSRLSEKFLYRHSDRLIVNSPGFIDHLISSGADRSKIVLVKNGVDPQQFHPDSDGLEFRQAHGAENKFVALYAGAHGLSNDLEIVLEAAYRLREEKDILFILVGDGKEKPNLALRATMLKLQNLLFLPPVPKSEIGGLLAACDCGIAILKPIPLYATTYPNKVFDYMAAGRPVVLAIDGVIRKVVEEAGAGIAIPPGDPAAMAEAVRRLASDPQLAREMGRRGRICVEKEFNRDDQAGVLERTFLLLAGRMKPAPASETQPNRNRG